ncbi:hypothetical protein E1193_05840 [Micromonospora sp. KC606]|uniref:hypothetical protein n=1 Tax=Micromonospora sp. KC606 TaxID=2530379 RepID=UPI001048FFFD|nr:hypothetical protein [Micromonospora sp. KC606]TDC84456.1 hypothetical protein E1193_05840 [Micromonospora sp. KC606]
MKQNPEVRFGEGRLARARRGLVAASVVVALAVVGLVAAAPLLRDHSQQRLEQRAGREVTATAQRTRTRLLADPAAGQATLRGIADRADGVEVLNVETGTTGVRLVFRVRVAKTASSVFGWQRATADGCFAQVVGPGSNPAGLERMPCPS